MNNKITFLIFLFFLVLYFLSTMDYKESFTTYNQCIEEGYPLGFCTQTPIESTLDYGYCNCAGGYFGSWHMEEGKCYCYLRNGIIPLQYDKPFETKPF